MRTAFLPFARPALGEEEIAEVVDTLRSGWPGLTDADQDGALAAVRDVLAEFAR